MGGQVHELLHASAGALFLAAGVSAIVDYRKLRDRISLNYCIMCLACGAYALQVVISHNLPKFGTFWIPWTLAGLVFTFVATLFYLRTIGAFLNISGKAFSFTLFIQGAVGAVVALDILAYFARGASLLFVPIPRPLLAPHQRALGEGAYSLLPFAEIIAGLFMLSFVVGITLAVGNLVRSDRKDPLLGTGLLVTGLFIVNDTLVAMSAYQGVYLLAFSKAFEAARIRWDIRLRTQEQMERRLRQAEKMQSIGRVAGGIAHDFGNLLTVIGGNVESAVYSLPERHPLRADLEVAMEGIERGRLLVGQLRDVARSKDTEAEAIDVQAFLKQSAKLLEGVLSPQIELTFDLDPDVGRVLMAPGHLTQVLINLVANARDAMPSGGRVLIRAFARSEQKALGLSGPHTGVVNISVIDEGLGIPSDVVDHIFEPLFTTKAERGGTGIGLATLFSIVHRAGGTVEVESESGHGTRFDVILPRLD